MPDPVLLTENHDIKLGGGSSYEAWYDCGFTTPVSIVVAQSNRGGTNSRRQWRWFGVARILTPAFLAGQAEELPQLLHLAKSDMSVRLLNGDHAAEEYLVACRDDAGLLAERAALVLGAVKTDTKKR